MRAASLGGNRSRTQARASTVPAQPPTACDEAGGVQGQRARAPGRSRWRPGYRAPARSGWACAGRSGRTAGRPSAWPRHSPRKKAASECSMAAMGLPNSRAMVGSAGRYMSMPMGVKTVRIPNRTISSNRRAGVKVLAGAERAVIAHRGMGRDRRRATRQGFVMDGMRAAPLTVGRHARIDLQSRQKHRHFRALRMDDRRRAICAPSGRKASSR